MEGEGRGPGLHQRPGVGKVGEEALKAAWEGQRRPARLGPPSFDLSTPPSGWMLTSAINL